MSTIHPECPGSDTSYRLEAADALLRQEPDQEEDEEEDKGDGKEDEENEDEHDDNDDDKGDGYQNVLKNPSIRIDARGVGVEFPATPITDAKTVRSAVEKFREKYGAQDVKKYYSKFDVAVVVELE